MHVPVALSILCFVVRQSQSGEGFALGGSLRERIAEELPEQAEMRAGAPERTQNASLVEIRPFSSRFSSTATLSTEASHAYTR